MKLSLHNFGRIPKLTVQEALFLSLLLSLTGCETPEQTAMLGGVLAGNAAVANNYQQAATYAAAAQTAGTIAQMQSQERVASVAGTPVNDVTPSGAPPSSPVQPMLRINDEPVSIWQWNVLRKDGTKLMFTLKVSADGDRLSGVLSGAFSDGASWGSGEILMGRVTGNEISFASVRNVNGQETTARYSGRINNDTIKGSILIGNSTLDWDAKAVLRNSLWIQKLNSNDVGSTSAPTTQLSGAGFVNVKAEDDSYEVIVDGKFVGNTPAKCHLPVGEHLVQVKRPGYKDYQRQVEVSDGAELNLRAVLEKQ